MNDWYIPITFLPGICLLILSTSNIMIALSNEIQSLIKTKSKETLIEQKLKQLKLINGSMVVLYISVAFFVISGLLAGVGKNLGIQVHFSIYILLAGIAFSIFALISLVVYSFRAVTLRQDQYHDNC